MIIVDASVATKWLFSEHHTDRALNLLATALSTKERIAAPPLLWIEMANILRQRVRQAGVTLDQALELFDRLQDMPVTRHAPSNLSRQALILADRYRLPAAYDAHYIAVAEMLGADFWTDDQRLLRDLAGRLAFVRWIGDFRS
jgi:predicted nucleic acid-binding protein